MNKYALSAALWAYVGWYAGSFVADLFNVSVLIGFVPGIAVAGLVLASSVRGIAPRLVRREVDHKPGERG